MNPGDYGRGKNAMQEGKACWTYSFGKRAKFWSEIWISTMKLKIWHLSMHTDLFKYTDVYGTGISHPPPIPFVHNPCWNRRQIIRIVCSFAIQFKHMHVLFLLVKWTAKQYIPLFFIKQLVKWILTSHQQHKVTDTSGQSHSIISKCKMYISNSLHITHK